MRCRLKAQGAVAIYKEPGETQTTQGEWIYAHGNGGFRQDGRQYGAALVPRRYRSGGLQPLTGHRQYARTGRRSDPRRLIGGDSGQAEFAAGDLVDAARGRSHRARHPRIDPDAGQGRRHRRRRQFQFSRRRAARQAVRRARHRLHGCRHLGRRVGSRQRLLSNGGGRQRGGAPRHSRAQGAGTRPRARLGARRAGGRGSLPQDDPQRHRIRHDAGLRRGLRVAARKKRIQSRSRRDRRIVAPQFGGAQLAARSHRRRAQARSKTRKRRALCGRFRRRPLDGAGIDRPGCADAGADPRAADALRQPGQGRLPLSAAIDDAQRLRRPRGEEGGRTRMMQPCSLVIFGATGNLARRKLMPSLFQLEEAGRLPEKMVIIAFGRRPWERSDWVKEVEGMLREKYAGALIAAAFERFKERLYYLQGDLHDSSAVEILKTTLTDDPRFPTNIIFYMAIRPSDFGESIQRLGSIGLLNEQNGWRRVVIEKPFGYDLLSAQILQQGMHKYLKESQIYRIDHYLGKGTVQNVLVFRFAN